MVFSTVAVKRPRRIRSLPVKVAVVEVKKVWFGISSSALSLRRKSTAARSPSRRTSQASPSMISTSPGRTEPSNSNHRPLMKLENTSLTPKPRPTERPPAMANRPVWLKPKSPRAQTMPMLTRK